MEKISKEELMKKLNLTEEEMEKVAGGGSARDDCFSKATSDCTICHSICRERFEETNPLRFDCKADCDRDEETRKAYCKTL